MNTTSHDSQTHTDTHRPLRSSVEFRFRRRRRREGFTLIEVMIVLFIMMTLAAAAILAYDRIRKGANINSVKLHIDLMKQPLDLFRLHMNRYPTTDEGLSALIECPTSANPDRYEGPYIDPAADRGTKPDPWDNPYQYESDGQQYRLWSLGPDGQPGTDDDISYTSTGV